MEKNECLGFKYQETSDTTQWQALLKPSEMETATHRQPGVPASSEPHE